MIRITVTGSSAGLARVLDLHPLVDNQCCNAVSHLQHKVQIPNWWAAKVARIANLADLQMAKGL